MGSGTQDATLKLPRGRLEAGGRARACVPAADAGVARRLGDQAAALARLERVIAPGKSEVVGAEVVFELGAERTGTLAADQAFAQFRRDPAAHVPILCGLARFLIESARDLEAVGLSEALWGMGPALVRFTPGREDPWRLMMVPQPRLRAADWAQADERVWLWAAPELVIGAGAGERRVAGTGTGTGTGRKAEGFGEAALAWAVGAALAHCLVGDRFPERLHRSERFARLVAGRVKVRGLEGAIARALPESFGDERGELGSVIAQLTELEPGRRPQGDALVELVAALSNRLGAHRLAARWAWEGKSEAARSLVQTHAANAPADEVPWSLVMRLDEARGDWEAALLAARHGLDRDRDGDGEREYVALVGRMCGRAPVGLIAGALKALDGHELDDVTRVFLAHLELRWLDDSAAALGRLGGMQTPWGECLALTVTARIAGARGDWVTVSRSAKQARERVAGLGPTGGGPAGRYVVAYVDALDGVANHGAVTLLGDPSYLVDAFECLARALNGAREAGADDLAADVRAWLGVLAASIERHGAKFATLLLGIRALGAATGGGPAALPWYDETRLFPRAERRGGP